MVRRPPGPKSRLEDGLRHLVPLEGGTPLGRIRAAIRDPQEAPPALRELASITEWIGGSADDRAHWLWGVISEQILQLYDGERGQPEREAVRAAFALAPGMAAERSVERRLALAYTRGDFGDCGAGAPRTYWGRGIARLARHVEAQLRESPPVPEQRSAPEARTEAVDRGALPSWIQDVVVDRMVATYRMRGRAVASAVTERSVTAAEDGVDRYVVWERTAETAADPVVEPALNCRAGPGSSLPDGRGGRYLEVPLILPRRLDRGESCFFSSEVTAQGEVPYVEEMVTSLGIAAGGLTIRIQFDRGAPPAAAWWYADASEARRLEPAPDGDPRRLTPSPFCYVEHTFAQRCEPRGRYGLAWQWA